MLIFALDGEIFHSRVVSPRIALQVRLPDRSLMFIFPDRLAIFMDADGHWPSMLPEVDSTLKLPDSCWRVTSPVDERYRHTTGQI